MYIIYLLKPTIGIDFLVKNINFKGSQLRVQLWDTAGQEKFKSLIPSYLRDATAAIFVFDLSSNFIIIKDLKLLIISKIGYLFIEIIIITKEALKVWLACSVATSPILSLK